MPYTPPAPGSADLVLSRPVPEGARLLFTGPPPPYSGPAHDAVHLTLAEPLPEGADLRIGGSDDAPALPDASATLTGRLVLRAGFNAHQHFEAALAGRLQLRAGIGAAYDNAVFRGPSASVAQAHTPAQVCHASASIEPWQTAQALPVVQALMFDPADAVPIDRVAAWAQAGRQPTAYSPAWGTAQAQGQAVALSSDQAAALHRPSASAWDVQAPSAGQVVDLSSDQAAATHRTHSEVWGSAQPQGRSFIHGFDQGAHAAHDTRATPWDEGRGVHSWGGPWVPWTPPPVAPVPVRVTLKLCQALPVGTVLVLGFEPCADLPTPGAFNILPARVYMTVHAIDAQRVSDNANVPLFDATLSADVGSFAWSLSASGPASLFELLAPTGPMPELVRLTLDGLQWVFAVEGLRRSSAFGKSTVALTGRSATAFVGAPWQGASARTNTGLASAQQLAEQALDLSGVALDWGLTDWATPIGAFSHSGTPLDAVQTLVQAAGGYVQSHRSLPTLLARHPYPPLTGGLPGGPWNWYDPTVTPDVALAPDAIITSAIERKDGPDINAVYVSGTNQGVLACVKRSATAGDKLAPMVTDALITHADAAAQRGLSILGTAGAQHAVSIELPVLTGSGQPGVLDVGQLVQVNESTPWRGRVRAVSVSARSPSLRQTITLERHL